jgi:hypothetical protein
MPYISSIVATFLGLALGLLLLMGQFAASPKFWTVFASIYAVVVAVTMFFRSTSSPRIDSN